MNRVLIKTLIVGDTDVECKTDGDLTKMTISNLNFIPSDLEGYDLIVYKGKRGEKILKSRYTTVGIIGG